MSYTVILGPRELHHVRTVEDYRRAHARAVARQAALGPRVAVHVVPGRKVARVDFGNWIVDCDCGAGNATDPQWGIACCFGCGAVHEHILFPDNRAVIERLLVARPKLATRFWSPGESVAALDAENIAHGVASAPPQEVDRGMD